MKANEVPEKIQIHFIKNDYDAWSIRGYSFLEDKQMGMVEYTRTDVFIEKAVSWLKEHREAVETEDNGIAGWIPDCFIEKLRNYLKGE